MTLQQVHYNKDLNEVTTTIKTAFLKASEMLRWPFISQGFGINEMIRDLVLDNSADLSIYFEQDETWYKITHENIKRFLAQYNSLWFVGKTKLYILPVEWFDRQ